MSSSAVHYSIDPPAVQIVNNNEYTFTARGFSPAGGISVSPSWSLSPSTIGTLNTTVGPRVILQTSQLGDAVLTATFDDGTVAISSIAVVAFESNANTFDVYVDDGLPKEGTIDSDIIAGNMTLSEVSLGYAAEGVKYMNASSGVNGSFWGVTVDKSNAGLSKNLHPYSSGSLRFSIKLSRALASAETIAAEVRDRNGTTVSVPSTLWTGFARTSTDWQDVTIPSSRFAGADMYRLTVVFALALNAFTPLSFDVDAVRWNR